METKEYYFTEKIYIPTKKQVVMDAIILLIKILVVVEGFGYILFKISRLSIEQFILCLAIQLVYEFVEKENKEIIIASVLQIKEDGIFLKQTSENNEVRKESILPIPWYEIQKVYVLKNFIKIYGRSRHELYINQGLISRVEEKNLVLPLRFLKKEEIVEICDIFAKNSKRGELYEK